jgi:CheY-like chemotaxis protein
MATSPFNILVVDDDEVDVMGIRRAIRTSKLDSRIHVARHGIEALAKLRGVDTEAVAWPYVILLDLNMPRMNGIEFLRKLRADPVHSSAIVFVLTTSASADDKAAAYAENVAGFIVKEKAGNDFLGLVRLLAAYGETVDLP